MLRAPAAALAAVALAWPALAYHAVNSSAPLWPDDNEDDVQEEGAPNHTPEQAKRRLSHEFDQASQAALETFKKMLEEAENSFHDEAVREWTKLYTDNPLQAGLKPKFEKDLVKEAEKKILFEVQESLQALAAESKKATPPLMERYIKQFLKAREIEEQLWKTTEETGPRTQWKYQPVKGGDIQVRALPFIDGPKTARVNDEGELEIRRKEPGIAFDVVVEKKAPNGVTFLKLAGGAGWLFDVMPAGLGIRRVCVRQEARPQRPAITSQSRGADGCPTDFKCCAPAMYRAPDLGSPGLDLDFEPACTSISHAPVPKADFQCRRVTLGQAPYIGVTWVTAAKDGRMCRPDFAPTLSWSSSGSWTRTKATELWAPGDVPPGGVGLHREKAPTGAPSVHWFPSLGPPCRFGLSDIAERRRGCTLDPLVFRPGQVDVHWSGFGTVPDLRYGKGLRETDSSAYLPFPAYCARGAVSILSTVYKRGHRTPGLASVFQAVPTFLDDWHLGDALCGTYTEKDYVSALDPGERKATCWNFGSDFIAVLCHVFRSCQCSTKDAAQCSDDGKIECCQDQYESWRRQRPS